ncbi:nucleotidyltransferase family protein [Cohnella silvisoli]|uniref:Nucleotidyltransferase family protein n=1 Tax=Cohnella silvisoli TaxID=2873699 RepID=A0ABV1KUY2_9BACL|nr:nucleotidyltransferase family protein [Cohnella silvisoli]MCD9023317.1 nucleotidyltransferase family protein [Cohnella silvisoli]
MRIAGIYLAAGQSKRMGIPKLSLELVPGSFLGSIALKRMLASKQIDTVTAVVRKSDTLNWIPEKEWGTNGSGKLRIARCEDAALGMSYSLREGLRATLSESPQAIMIVLADQPFITSELLDNLVAVYRDRPDLDFVACVGANAAMPPVLFAPSMFDAISRLEGDRGARKLLASPAYRGSLVPVKSDLVFTDIDTPLELTIARNSWMTAKSEREGGDGDDNIGFGGNESNMQEVR